MDNITSPTYSLSPATLMSMRSEQKGSVQANSNLEEGERHGDSGAEKVGSTSDTEDLTAITDRVARLEVDLRSWRETCVRANDQVNVPQRTVRWAVGERVLSETQRDELSCVTL